MTDKANSSAESTGELLKAGVAAARAGQREQARELLSRVVKRDDKNVTAWLWLSSVVDDVANREVCLEHVLSLDPENEAARRGLARIRQQKLEGLLHEGIAAARRGQRDHARNLLTRYVEQDETSVAAWLWLSGVVGGLDDREVCLENVLALDPDNEAAWRGLAEVREQKEILVATRAEAAPVFEPVEPPPAAEGVDASAAEEWEFTPLTDEFSNEYLCPYCATPTAHEDKKCPACRHSLWIRTRKREERSTWLWVALTMQVANVGWGAASLVFVLIAISAMIQLLHDVRVDLNKMVQAYLGVTGDMSPEVVDLILGYFPALAFFGIIAAWLFSLAVLVAMFLRWKPAWYLYLVSAVLGLVSAVVSMSQAGPICGGVGVLIAVGMVLLAFQVQDDFFFVYTRILLRPDREAAGGLDFMAHGQRYFRRGMWALAALHFRRAVGYLPDRLEPHLLAATAYIQLKRYDQAAESLAEARRIGPDDPRIDEVADLLAEARAKQGD